MIHEIHIPGEFYKPFKAIVSGMALTESKLQIPIIFWLKLFSASQVLTKHCTIGKTDPTAPAPMGTFRPMVFRLWGREIKSILYH